jgi:hypothetical protein
MSSDNAEFVEQPDGARLWTPCSETRNGGAVRVRCRAQISDATPALVSEKRFKKGRVALAPYVLDKKWKVVWRFNTSNTTQLDSEYRNYYQYYWMEKSSMKMLLWHILVFHVLQSTIMLVVWAGILF